MIPFILVCIVAFCVSGAEEDDFVFCPTDTIYEGDTLTLILKIPHRSKMGIFSPRKGYYYLIVDDEVYNGCQHLKTEIRPEEFIEIDTLTFVTNKTKAYVFRHCENEKHLIFISEGQYRFLITDNLHTENIPSSYCTIYYGGKRIKK